MKSSILCSLHKSQFLTFACVNSLNLRIWVLWNVYACISVGQTRQSPTKGRRVIHNLHSRRWRCFVGSVKASRFNSNPSCSFLTSFTAMLTKQHRPKWWMKMCNPCAYKWVCSGPRYTVSGLIQRVWGEGDLPRGLPGYHAALKLHGGDEEPQLLAGKCRAARLRAHISRSPVFSHQVDRTAKTHSELGARTGLVYGCVLASNTKTVLPFCLSTCSVWLAALHRQPGTVKTISSSSLKSPPPRARV